MRSVWIDSRLLLARRSGSGSPFSGGVISELLRFKAEPDMEIGIIPGRSEAGPRKLLRNLLQSEGVRIRREEPGKIPRPGESFLRYRAGKIHFREGEEQRVFDNLSESVTFLLTGRRSVTVSRNTNETQISAEVNLDGDGRYRISTGLGFFDHMLEQLARHSLCDITLRVKGDLAIDEHHTIEDTALALGEAFNRALGDRRGIGRYGFVLPMDEAQAKVAVDLSGRPYLIWRAAFRREKIGDMPTEMFRHFFKSFADAARLTLQIAARGENEHHKIEAIFKGVARALRMAIRRETGIRSLPTTKGVL